MPATSDQRRDSLRDERQGPFTVGGFIIMVVLIAAAVVITLVLQKPAPIPVTETPGAEGGATRSEAELMAPVVELPEEVVVSVREGGGGTEIRTAVLSISIKIGKVEGRDEEKLDLGYLNKVYVPKVKALLPNIRHLLITAASKESLQDLMLEGTRDKIREDLKRKINDLLHQHGAEKRVSEVLWGDCHFD